MNDKIALILHSLAWANQFHAIQNHLRGTPLRYVFEKRNIYFTTGSAPCKGRDWVNTCGSVDFSVEGLADLSPHRLVRHVAEKKRKMMLEMVPVFVENLKVATGTEDPSDDWVLVVLEGFWMRHTRVPVDHLPVGHLKGDHVYFFDCTYCFIPRDEWMSHRKGAAA